MPESFDPYLEWLGIRDPKRPPNAYRLLGVDLFESDPTVLSNAADRQMAHVRTFQSGPHAEAASRLLNQIAQAKLCLVDPKKKAAYDARLRQRQQAEAPKAVAAASRPAAPSVAVGPSRVPPEPRKSGGLRNFLSTLLMVVVLGAIVLVAAVRFGVLDKDKLPGPIAEQLGGKAAAVPEPDAAAERQPDADQPELRDNPTDPNSPTSHPQPADAAAPDFSLPERSGVPPPGTSASTGAARPYQPRFSIPQLTEQRAMLRKIRRLFDDDYQNARSPAQKQQFAALLLRKGIETMRDPVARYVLLVQACEQAIDAGDTQTFMTAARQLGDDYECEWRPLAAETLLAEARQARDDAANQAMGKLALRLAEESLAEANLDAAGKASEAARDMARKARDGRLLEEAVDLMRDVEALQHVQGGYRQAQPVLVEQPDNPSANWAAGAYAGFVEGDWAEAAARLAQAESPALAALAEAERKQPQAATLMLDVARQWDAVISELDGNTARLARKRAIHWYRQALPNLRGLTETETLRRLEQLLAE